MSVLIETSIGDIVIDLYTKDAPKATYNFLKLCKIKYFNNSIFYEVQRDFITLAGIPLEDYRTKNILNLPTMKSEDEQFTDSVSFNNHIKSTLNKEQQAKQEKINQLKQTLKSKNELKALNQSTSIYGITQGDDKKFFEDEIDFKKKHNKKGVVSTSNLGANLNTSTFFITLTDRHISQLDYKHTIFGQVEEGLDILDKINKCLLDDKNQPYQNIRIKHTVVLDDPFEDSNEILNLIPNNSPIPIRDIEYNRLDDDFNINEYYEKINTKEKLQAKIEEHEAKNRAIALTLLEDLPDADVKPPDNVLFICKLNPITEDSDLEDIFSKFGPIKSCRIMRDGDKNSLKYGFIEFEESRDCEEAFIKMNGAIIDDRKIKVDFSQSVNKNYSKVKKVVDYEKEYNEKNKRREIERNQLNFDNKKLTFTNNAGLFGDGIDSGISVGKKYEKGLVYEDDYYSKSKSNQNNNIKFDERNSDKKDNRDRRSHNKYYDNNEKKYHQYDRKDKYRERSYSRDKENRNYYRNEDIREHKDRDYKEIKYKKYNQDKRD